MMGCTFWKDQCAIWILEGNEQRSQRQDECLGAAADAADREGRRVALMSEVVAELERGGQVPGT